MIQTTKQILPDLRSRIGIDSMIMYDIVRLNVGFDVGFPVT